jgi:hypothetical protein
VAILLLQLIAFANSKWGCTPFLRGLVTPTICILFYEDLGHTLALFAKCSFILVQCRSRKMCLCNADVSGVPMTGAWPNGVILKLFHLRTSHRRPLWRLENIGTCLALSGYHITYRRKTGLPQRIPVDC